ncbi:hypothetical protein [Haloferax elongans]|nr:hypothetical protein [Haloferax elongans]
MHHVHLPKLRQMGIIESSGEQSHVSRGPHFDDIVPLLRIIDTYRDELPTDVL